MSLLRTENDLHREGIVLVVDEQRTHLQILDVVHTRVPLLERLDILFLQFMLDHVDVVQVVNRLCDHCFLFAAGDQVFFESVFP